MVFNDTTQAAELLAYYYYRAWSNPHVQLSSTQMKETKDENAQRCIQCLKVLFVFSLSAMEYNAKALFGRNNYLREIMKKSANNELIDGNTLKDWEHIIDIRNCIVHNNAIASKDADYTIGGLHVVTTKNVMMQGKLDFFLVLTDLTVDRHYDWVKALIAKSL